jgi:hypothetical protein
MIVNYNRKTFMVQAPVSEPPDSKTVKNDFNSAKHKIAFKGAGAAGGGDVGGGGNLESSFHI